jgi:hypothetical protein
VWTSLLIMHVGRELEAFRRLICTTRTDIVFGIRVCRIRMYIRCICQWWRRSQFRLCVLRALSLGVRITLHNRLDGASEISNCCRARLAESRAMIVFIVPEHVVALTQQSTSCMRSTSCMVVDDKVVVTAAVVVAASTVCLVGGITGICQTAPLLIIVSAWPAGACILPVW